MKRKECYMMKKRKKTLHKRNKCIVHKLYIRNDSLRRLALFRRATEPAGGTVAAGSVTGRPVAAVVAAGELRNWTPTNSIPCVFP